MSINHEPSRAFYQCVSQEVGRIISNLTQETSDETLRKTNADAREKLEAFRKILNENIDSLRRNAEWDTFTIAFYGETNAGKSTVIETLRILLKEESKLQQQKAFLEYQKQHQLTDSEVSKLQQELDDNQQVANKISGAIEIINEQYVDRENVLHAQIHTLNTLILAQKQLSSSWQKLLSFFRKTHEQKEYAHLLVKQRALSIEKAAELKVLNEQQQDCDLKNTELLKLISLQQEKIGELARLADGGIIGTGVSDFTLDTTLYSFKANQQNFALIDVPGIEGKESAVLAQIQQAVEKAHAVFYVTSKATAPQKGDENNPGTLEKIKSHLNAQTEVWTLFNKRITNPMQLKRAELLSSDEVQSLSDLDNKMREQLGDNYRDSFTLSAMP
ncbi:GTPase domain-containing protein [Plesiomonas shigelloides]|uniref:GTPase n=1 Tax=Plesiomonas shigelloides TaxID=703 RepID=UPI00351D73D6